MATEYGENSMPEMKDVFAEINGFMETESDESLKLVHLHHLFEGYRAFILGDHADNRPYSSGSARQSSFDLGYRLAQADKGLVSARQA